MLLRCHRQGWRRAKLTWYCQLPILSKVLLCSLYKMKSVHTQTTMISLKQKTRFYAFLIIVSFIQHFAGILFVKGTKKTIVDKYGGEKNKLFLLADHAFIWHFLTLCKKSYTTYCVTKVGHNQSVGHESNQWAVISPAKMDNSHVAQVSVIWENFCFSCVCLVGVYVHTCTCINT